MLNNRFEKYKSTCCKKVTIKTLHCYSLFIKHLSIDLTKYEIEWYINGRGNQTNNS